MKQEPASTCIAPFAVWEEPRIERQQRPKLLDSLVLAVCAVLCGAESFPASEDVGEARHEGLKQFLELPGGIASPSAPGHRAAAPAQLLAHSW